MKYLWLLLLLLFSCTKKSTEPYGTSTTPLWVIEPTEIDTSNTTGNYKQGRKGTEQVRAVVQEYYHRATLLEQSPYTPFYNYQLGLNLLRSNEPAEAYRALSNIVSLSDTAQFTNKIRRLETVEKLKDISTALALRTLAIGEYHTAFDTVAKNYMPIADDARLHTAYAMMNRGNAEATVRACERAVNTAGYRRLYKRSSVTAGVAGILYGIGEWDALRELTQWMVDLGDSPTDSTYMKFNNDGTPNEYYLNQWSSSYDIVMKFRELAEKEPVRFHDLTEGVYHGTVRGFIDTLSVWVTVRDDSVNSIAVQSVDDRPFSAIDIIPERMMDSRSITVDAITEATITSEAIIAATAEALVQAQE